MSYLKLLPNEQPCPDCTDDGVRVRYACSNCGDEGVVLVEEDEKES